MGLSTHLSQLPACSCNVTPALCSPHCVSLQGWVLAPQAFPFLNSFCQMACHSEEKRNHAHTLLPEEMNLVSGQKGWGTKGIAMLLPWTLLGTPNPTETLCLQLLPHPKQASYPTRPRIGLCPHCRSQCLHIHPETCPQPSSWNLGIRACLEGKERFYKIVFTKLRSQR